MLKKVIRIVVNYFLALIPKAQRIKLHSLFYYVKQILLYKNSAPPVARYKKKNPNASKVLLGIKSLYHYIKIIYSENHIPDSVKRRYGIPRTVAPRIQAMHESIEVMKEPYALPDWVISEINELSDIEQSIYLSESDIQLYTSYIPPENTEPGEVFNGIVEIISDQQVDCIFFIPWVVQGGADKAVLNYVKSAKKMNLNPIVFTTLDSDSIWIEKLEELCTVVPFVKIASKLNHSEKVSLLATVVNEYKPQYIKIINSYLGWEMISKYGKNFKYYGIGIFAVVFCEDINDKGMKWSFPRLFLDKSSVYITKIFTDSEYYKKTLIEQNGPSIESKIEVVKLPRNNWVDTQYRSQKIKRILWAGRFCDQKRPDLILEIADQLPDWQFILFGTGLEEYDVEFSRKILSRNNITNNGGFEMPEDILSCGPYFCYLFTSNWEGMPLSLMDFTELGLPIIASNVGGVDEFLDVNNSILIEPQSSYIIYVNAIKMLYKNCELSNSMWLKARDKLVKEREYDQFHDRISSLLELNSKSQKDLDR